MSVLQLFDQSGDILLINAYLPYHNSSDFQNQYTLYRDTLGFIESVLTENNTSRFIVLLDMNCNLYDKNHPYSKLLHNLMTNYSLFSAFDLCPDFDPFTSFTRSDVKLGSYTLIDGILLSDTLRSIVSNVCISDYGDNVSDHVPVELEISVDIAEIVVEPKKVPRVVIWDKLSPGIIMNFRVKMREALGSIEVPFHSLLHGDKCCSDDNHKYLLESYYLDIVNAVQYVIDFYQDLNLVYRSNIGQMN
jgi:hypothetical protein